MFIMRNFVDEVKARLKGDDDAKITAQNERKASNAFKQQISSLEGSALEAQDKVEEALDQYHNAIYCTIKIVNSQGYMETIARRKEALDNAQDNFEAIQDSIDVWKKLQQDIFNKKQ